MDTDGFQQAGSRGELTVLSPTRFGSLWGSLSAAFFLLLIGWLHATGACGATDEDFSIVVLPDTQIYAWKHPELFHAQTRWIAERRAKYNIEYVLHVGDVVEHNNEKEWKIAREALALLDGKVPYAIALGNHDIGPGGSSKTRDTLFGEYFLLREIKKWESFGGVYDKEPDKGENIYHVFRAGGRQWLALVLEFGPRDDVLRWAREVVAGHPECPVILITHAYLHNDGKRYDRAIPGQNAPPQDFPMAGDRAGLNTGEDIWRKLVSKNRNTVMVISGHVCVAARLTSKGEAGNRVHQMVVDYQDQERGGNGWLRLLRFSRGGRTVQVRDYSPVLDEWSGHPDRHFDLHLDLP